MPVSIVIPTYNRPKALNRLLQSINKSEYQGDIETIVVDGTGLLEKDLIEHSIDELITGDREYSLAECRNIGMKKSSYEYIFIIDDDNVVDDFCICELITAIRSSQDIGAAAPFMYYLEEPDRIWCGGVVRDDRTTLTNFIAKDDKNSKKYDGKTFNVDDAPNAVMLDKSVIDEIGYHNSSRFPIEFEHCELLERAKQAGYQIVSVADANVYHSISVNQKPRYENSKRMYYRARNRILFQRQFRDGLNIYVFFAFLPILTVGYLYKFFRYSDHPVQISYIFLIGTFDGLRDRDSYVYEENL